MLQEPQHPYKAQNIPFIILSQLLMNVGITISNGPQNITVCMNAMGEINCGFHGADPDAVVPDWKIIKRSRNGSIVSNVSLSGQDISYTKHFQ